MVSNILPTFTVHSDKMSLESGSSSWEFTPAVLTKDLNRTLPHVKAGNLKLPFVQLVGCFDEKSK